MPTNLFDSSETLRQRAARNLGFDASSMIQGMAPVVMEHVEERRRMGQRKFSEDILSQQLTQAAQDLQNRVTGYRFGQEQDYYSGLQTPEGQAMWKAYQERLKLPATGPVTNPHQIRDLGNLQQMATGQDDETKKIAALLLQYNPGGTGPELDWARSVLGVPGPSASAGPGAPTVTPPSITPSSGRSGMGVFLNRAVPAGVGTGGAAAAFTRTPGPIPAKLASAGIVGIGGERLSRMVMGDLTPEEEAAHPTAKSLGDIVGFITGALGGRKLGGPSVGKGGSLGGGGASIPPGIRIKKGFTPRPHNVGGSRPINTGSGVGQTAQRMQKQPFNVAQPQPQPISPTPLRVGGPAPIPMAQPVNTPPLPPQAPIPTGYKIPMGNQPVGTPPLSPPLNIPGNFTPGMPQPVSYPGLPPQPPIPLNPQLEKYIQQMMQGPQLPSVGPGVTDPQMQLFIQQLFKKVQPGQIPPG